MADVFLRVSPALFSGCISVGKKPTLRFIFWKQSDLPQVDDVILCVSPVLISGCFSV
jgi:hypothetical protein